MSDTPRTDAAFFNPMSIMYDPVSEMKILERELNAANERIKSLIEERDRANRLADWKWNLRGEFESLLGTDKIEEGIEAVNELKRRIQRLEEAGNEMMSEPCEYTFEQWIKAKEAKP